MISWKRNYLKIVDIVFRRISKANLSIYLTRNFMNIFILHYIFPFMLCISSRCHILQKIWQKISKCHETSKHVQLPTYMFGSPLVTNLAIGESSDNIGAYIFYNCPTKTKRLSQKQNLNKIIPQSVFYVLWEP